MLNPVTIVGGGYQTVTASQSATVLGHTGAAGDTIYSLLVIPATLVPGSVVLTDGTLTPFVAFAGGTVASVTPFTIPVNVTSSNGAWKITTGANVSVLASGNFTY